MQPNILQWQPYEVPQKWINTAAGHNTTFTVDLQKGAIWSSSYHISRMCTTQFSMRTLKCAEQYKHSWKTCSLFIVISLVRPHAIWCLGVFPLAQTLSPLTPYPLCLRRGLAGWHPSALCLTPTRPDHVLHFIYLMLCSTARPGPEARTQTDMHLQGIASLGIQVGS